MFIVKCSWCNREISRSPGKNAVSHGICPSCYARVRKEIRNFMPRVNLIRRAVLGENTLVEQF